MTATTFNARVLAAGLPPLRADGVRVLQVNLGYRCNLSCRHCHIEGGPARAEFMDAETAARVLRVLRENPLETLDLTGGAPELNPHFRTLVAGARRAGRQVIVRSNLSVLLEPGQEDTPEFLRDNEAELVASLPCYLEDGVDQVRGGGTYARCITALRRLNALGYGTGAAAPALRLVYNPSGATLAPAQGELQEAYRRELAARHGVSFSSLYAFTNMPIGRFRDFLQRTGSLDQYLERLARAFNPRTLESVMCRQFVSVGWDGALYDCDFNQALGLPVATERSRRIDAFDYRELAERVIAVGDHCYGCTAGHGSSCLGAVA